MSWSNQYWVLYILTIAIRLERKFGHHFGYVVSRNELTSVCNSAHFDYEATYELDNRCSLPIWWQQSCLHACTLHTHLPNEPSSFFSSNMAGMLRTNFMMKKLRFPSDRMCGCCGSSDYSNCGVTRFCPSQNRADAWTIGNYVLIHSRRKRAGLARPHVTIDDYSVALAMIVPSCLCVVLPVFVAGQLREKSFVDDKRWRAVGSSSPQSSYDLRKPFGFRRTICPRRWQEARTTTRTIVETAACYFISNNGPGQEWGWESRADEGMRLEPKSKLWRTTGAP